ncbi:DUF805 domain-containing protein [Staphylococcus sp. NRL 16/872]|uniref:DUF805 domain-containing protein n=1 Tax=Staphylococcus sp. NRL 16/872 TaxID=2930131 RepID=UPI001FB41C22|nr:MULTISPECIES: DUF805 domain-containing protein [unclassified Staphylococcus]MCJ1655278.1 DUF805 domain-containing protein [Staphylococcus sp. NRL 21/187]MCJ1661111.1 DUF805 domain-containing protein [Staphylococcus sp. NRL 18/288]MCJ1667008.1 DUF805 domain-containing protein [Staphylococcus sp. NRL 19/737]WEN69481.1 DUF805 domain-containing protein [Staphylococcus sp. NRL 16/872]
MDPKVTFGRAFILFWKNYFNFKGRSRRSEYWFVQLWHLIFHIPAVIIYSTSIVFFVLAYVSRENMFMATSLIMLICVGLYATIYALVILIPQLALTARRFHDTNRTMFVPILYVVVNIIGFIGYIVIGLYDSDLNSGWSTSFVLVYAFISFVIGIYQIVIACFDSKVEKNKYGESPKFKNLKRHNEEI